MMTEIESPVKACPKCGTKCDRLVLVCTACSEVLPDGEYALLELPRDETSNSKLGVESLPSEIIPKSASGDIPVRKVVLFLLVFALLVWLASRFVSNLPG